MRMTVLGATLSCWDCGFGSYFSTPDFIRISAPQLSHPHPLVPLVAAIVGTSDGVIVAARLRTLDGVAVPQAAVVEQGRGVRAETVGGHVVRSATHAEQRDVDRVLAHRAVRGVGRGESRRCLHKHRVSSAF